MSLLPPLSVDPGLSSYFSAPRPELDPKLFSGGRVKPEIRDHLLSTLYTFWRERYANPEGWSKVWIAGSAASYQWHGDRGVADLDILIGVNFPKFSVENPLYASMPQEEVAQRFNVQFYHELNPQTADWNGFEITWFVNPGARDIRAIRPYAAYNLTENRWTVAPPQLPPEWNPRTFFPQPWWSTVNKEIDQVKRLISNYNAGGSAGASTVPELLAKYSDIHTGRKVAFGANGQGYVDFQNFRWQAHKMAGTEQAMRSLRDFFA